MWNLSVAKSKTLFTSALKTYKYEVSFLEQSSVCEAII